MCFSSLRGEVRWTASWDPSMLHIAEWVKYFGAFFNLEAEAEAHFNEVSGYVGRSRSQVACRCSSLTVFQIQLCNSGPASAFHSA